MRPPTHLRRTVMAGVTALAILAGGTSALVLGSSATAAASASQTWTSYDLSTQNGVQVTGRPALLADPQNGQQDIATASPSGGIELWQGDGAIGASAQNMNANSDNPTSSQYDTGNPSLLKDPQSGDLLIFTDSQGSTGCNNLETYDRTPSTGQWDAYNLSNDTGQCVSASPSETVFGNLIYLGETNGSDGVVFTRTSAGAWSSQDVTTHASSGATQSVAANTSPGMTVDVNDDYVDEMTVDPSGNFTAFTDPSGVSGTWAYYNLTADSGGSTITGDPVTLQDGPASLVFGRSSNGDLIEFEQAKAGVGWTSANLTTQFGGPTITSDVSAVLNANTIDVFAQGADDNLIEYVYTGTGWTATDLTTADGAAQIASAPAATISASTGNLAVFATGTNGDLVESELEPSTATSTQTVTTVTETTPGGVVTTPSTKPTGTKRPTVKVTVRIHFIPSRRTSELVWVKLGKLKTDERVTVACRGTGLKHRTGCPYRTRTARGPAALRKLVAHLARTHYGVGDVLTLTVAEPGLKSYVAHITIRSNRLPKVTA